MMSLEAFDANKLEIDIFAQIITELILCAMKFFAQLSYDLPFTEIFVKAVFTFNTLH